MTGLSCCNIFTHSLQSDNFQKLSLCKDRVYTSFCFCNVKSLRLYLLCLMSDCAPSLCCLHGAILCTGGGSQNTVALKVAIQTSDAYTYTHSYCPSMQKNKGDRVRSARLCYIQHTHSQDPDPAVSIVTSFERNPVRHLVCGTTLKT